MDAAMIAVLSTCLAAVVGGIVALVRLAVQSETRRADDWREIARTEQRTGEIRDAQVGQLVAAVKELTAAQRESLATLRTVAESVERGRGAA